MVKPLTRSLPSIVLEGTSEGGLTVLVALNSLSFITVKSTENKPCSAVTIATLLSPLGIGSLTGLNKEVRPMLPSIDTPSPHEGSV